MSTLNILSCPHDPKSWKSVSKSKRLINFKVKKFKQRYVFIRPYQRVGGCVHASGLTAAAEIQPIKQKQQAVPIRSLSFWPVDWKPHPVSRSILIYTTAQTWGICPNVKTIIDNWSRSSIMVWFLVNLSIPKNSFLITV